MPPSFEKKTLQHYEFRQVAISVCREVLVVKHRCKGERGLGFRGMLSRPRRAPIDMFEPPRHLNIKLYVLRIFITGDGRGVDGRVVEYDQGRGRLPGCALAQDLPVSSLGRSSIASWTSASRWPLRSLRRSSETTRGSAISGASA